MKDRIAQARIDIILDAPFFGSLLSRLEMVEDASVETARTNGRVIRYNPDYCQTLTDPQLRGLIVHEVGHPALGHLWRREDRDPKGWNVAADFALNNWLKEYIDTSGHAFPPFELPPGSLIDPSLKDLSAEQIYNRLPRNPGGGRSGDEFQNPGPGTFEDPPDDQGDGDGQDRQGQAEGNGSCVKPTNLEDQWKQATVAAAMAERTRQQGKTPSCLQRMLGDLLAPRIPWQERLREFIRRRARDNYSWRKPNRRYIGTSFMLPGVHSYRMGPIVAAIDTSGSIGQKMLDQFAAELQAILDECKPESIHIVTCDAAIHTTDTFTHGDNLIGQIKLAGGGGTDFRPVFDYVDRLPEDAECLIYLTDLCGSFPEKAPHYPVLWVLAEPDGSAPKPPFGEVVS